MFKVISDTACDLSKEYTDSNNIGLVPLYVTFDGEKYYKEQIDITDDEFYRQMIEEGSYPKSSLPTIQDFIDAFMPSVTAGVPIICICISTLFSGSYNSATNARNQILEDYPDAKITIFNSMQNSSSMALFVHEAERMSKDNVDYDDAVRVLTRMTDLGRIYFTVGSLDYLQKGGRIGKLARLISGKLSILPVIVLKNGELNIGGISRTRKKAKLSMLDCCKKHFSDNNLSYEDYLFNVDSGCDFEEKDEYRQVVEETFSIKCVESTEYFPTRIGVATACHTGPYALGIGIMPKYETLL